MKLESKVKSPSLNPETPPLMIIKSHVIDKATIEMKTIESKVKQPMSIKSKILSAPKPAESMEIIMKKIREDVKNKEELSQARQPAIVKKSKPVKTGKEKLELDPIQTEAIVKPAKKDAIEFMKKIELMKEKETKSGQSNIDENEVVTKSSRLENTQTRIAPIGRY